MDWAFQETVETQGFNNGAMDNFRNDITSSVVREIVQNSVDAASGYGPVKIRFSLHTLDLKKVEEISKLKGHFEEIVGQADSPKAEAFFESGIKVLEAPKVKLLGVHDFGTTGLSGPINGPKGQWFTLVRSTGKSDKNKVGSGGSFGHGSKAAFLISGLRTVFYYSVIPLKGQENRLEKRFMGKTILQSRQTPELRYLSATGFYGLKKPNEALINDDVPNWAQELRGTDEIGTSLYIAHLQVLNASDFFENVRATLLANFYLAFEASLLEVELEDLGTISHDTLESQFKDARIWLQNSKTNKEDSLHEKFESIETIKYGERGVLHSKDFGEVAYYYRVGEEVKSKRVSIARAMGMLITQRPLLLTRIGTTGNFDSVFWIRDENGSDALSKMEPPAHNKFSFDEVEFSERTSVEAKYRGLVAEIKSVLESISPLVSSQEIEFENLFGISTTSSKKELDALKSLPEIVASPERRPRVNSVPKLGDSQTGPGRGKLGGQGKRKSRGGNIPGGGEGLAHFAWANEILVENARFKFAKTAPAQAGQKILVELEVNQPGDYWLVVTKSGEDERELIQQNGFEDFPGSKLRVDKPGILLKEIELKIDTNDDFDFGIQMSLVPASEELEGGSGA